MTLTAAIRPAFLAGVVAVMTACASSPSAGPAAPAPAPAPPVPLDRKVSWILRLEQQRVLEDRAAGASLMALLADADASVRRRSAIAIGRVDMADGVAPLIKALADTDDGVRASAAFALGLVGDAAAVAPLESALADASALVRGRAAEALGLIGSKSSAQPIGASAKVCPAHIAPIPADDEEYPRSPEVEACRLAIFALVRLAAFPELASVVLSGRGEPVSHWWPVAYSLQRINDKRAADALATLSTVAGVYTPAFAIRGLADLKDARLVAPALAAAESADADVRLRAAAIRALGALREPQAVPPLLALATSRSAPRNLTLEAIAALGAIGNARALDPVLDLFRSSSPQVRAAAMAAAARIDVDSFLLSLSVMERDRDWWVRAQLADTLAGLPRDRALPALEELAGDEDARVQAPALRALAALDAPDLDRRVSSALVAPDFALRATAATILGERKPADGAPRLVLAYGRGDGDATPAARIAALEALAKYTTPEVAATLTQALADREWAVRIRAAALLTQRGVPAAGPMRPAPLRQSLAFFESERLLRPKYSPQAFIETALGTIQIELDVINAPLTTGTFVELARAGFFNGIKAHRVIANFVVQAGDPRGDGEGGPGYAIRDELSTRPFLRGVVGMALDGPETGGSQFFITVSPQPHLDGKFTVFGRVVRGLELLDQLSPGETIVRVTIADGTEGSR